MEKYPNQLGYDTPNALGIPGKVNALGIPGKAKAGDGGGILGRKHCKNKNKTNFSEDISLDRGRKNFTMSQSSLEKVQGFVAGTSPTKKIFIKTNLNPEETKTPKADANYHTGERAQS